MIGIKKYIRNKYAFSYLIGIVLLLLLNSISAAAASERKVALVIGNADYEMSPLINPTNDSRDIANKLKLYGFDVIYRENVKMRQIGSILNEFKSKLTSDTTALVFYAGHGLQVRGENYFPTVDAIIRTEEEVQNQSIGLKQILDILEDAKTRTNIILLDACRNNPFERKGRSQSRGLASVNAPSGTMIAYSTRPGSIAEDGNGKNGLYTEQLLKIIDNKKPIEQLLKQLVSSVKAASNGRQEPWSEGSLEGDFCFGGCIDDNSEKLKLISDVNLWESIIGSNSISDYENYLKNYPSGTFSSLARKTISNLMKVESNNLATNKEIANELNSALLKQAEEIKKQELIRIDKEISERQKLLISSQDKLKIETENKIKLEAELAKAKQETEILRQSQINKEPTQQAPKKVFVPPSL